MREYLDVLKRAVLFDGLNEDEIFPILDCLNARVKSYGKNEIVFADGDVISFVGVILEGELQTKKMDYHGNSNIISKLFPSSIIGASACYSLDKRLPFDVSSASTSRILFLDAGKIIQSCKNVCSFHARLIKNMLGIIAERNIVLAEKIDVLTKRTIKEKVLAYLVGRSRRAKSAKFSIPLSRKQMAEYLSINRSALSRELCALRDEGILEFNANSFTLNEFEKG